MTSLYGHLFQTALRLDRTSTTRKIVYVLALLWCVSSLGVIESCNNNPLGPPPRGKAWVIFNNSNSPLRSDNVNFVFVSSEGATWMGTDSGAFKFQDQGWSFYRDSLAYWVYLGGFPPPPPVLVASVRCISEGRDGSMWFGTDGGGLVRMDQFSEVGVWQKYTSPSDLQYNIVTGVSCQFVQEGDVWAATSFGASRYIPSSTVKGAGSWEQYTSSSQPEIPNPPSISTVAVNPFDTKTWFGTYNYGLISFDYTENAWTTAPAPGGVADPQVNAFGFQTSGLIWIAMNSAIGEFDPVHSSWVNIFTGGNTNGLLPITGANSVATDGGSLCYFATSSGLLRLQDSTWTMLNSTNSPLPSNHVNSVMFDQRGNLWVGTDSGCAAYNPAGTLLQ